MRAPLLFVLTALVAAVRGGSFHDPDGNFQAEWTVNGDRIEFTITAPTLGYVALGVSGSEASMVGADCFVGWVTADGIGVLEDAMAFNYSRPKVDNSDDLTLLHYQQTDTSTSITFSRALDTGDDEDVVIRDGEMYLLWAIGTFDPDSNYNYEKHSKMGSASVMFLADAALPAEAVAHSVDRRQALASTTPNYQSGNFKVWWTLNDTHIRITMQQNTNGWISVGFNSRGLMSGADTFTGWVTNGGSVVLYDEHCTGHSLCPQDINTGGKYDLQEISGSQVGGVTSISFTRLRNTGDAKDYTISSSSVYLIWASYTSDGSGNTYAEHNLYGSKSVNLAATTTTTTTTKATTTTTAAAGGPATTTTTTAAPGANGQHYFENSRKNFRVWWLVSGDVIHVTMEGNTEGYISIGLSRNSRMPDTDVIMGWVDDSSGEVVVLDQYCDSYQQSENDIDGVNDVYNITGTQANGITTISFTRKIDTGKAQDYPFIPGSGSIVMQYASAPNDGIAARRRAAGSYILYKHTVVGAVSMNFATGAASGELASHDIEPGYILAAIVALFLCLLAVFKGLSYICASRSQPSLWIRMCATFPRLCGILQSRTVLFDVPFWIFLVFLVYVAANMLLLFFLDSPYTMGQKVGFLAAANSVILVLPALRNSVLTLVTGDGVAHLIVFHRWIGRFAIGVAVAHMLIYLVEWIKNDEDLVDKFFMEDKYLKGVIALGAGILIFLTSFEFIRRRIYNVFLFIHIPSFAVFFAYIYMHTPVGYQPYLIVVCVLYGLDHLCRLAMYLTSTTSASVEKMGDFVKVSLRRPPLFQSTRPGSYVFLNIPSISLWEFHPFSVASSPEERDLEVDIKALGNFTQKLASRASKSARFSMDANSLLVNMHVQGPYGGIDTSLLNMKSQIYIAGGVGITPIMGILRYIYMPTVNRVVGCDPKNRVSAGSVLAFPPNDRNGARNSAGNMNRPRVRVVWSIRSYEQYSTFQESFKSFAAAASVDVSLPRFSLYIFVSDTKSDRFLAPQGSSIYFGRPDVDLLLKQFAEESPNEASFVFACGPSGLVTSARSASVSRSLSGTMFYFHSEEFAF